MKYDYLVYKLRKSQAVKIHWNNHEIDILLNKGFVWVESIPAAPLQVFHSLPEALDQWYYPEVRTTLNEIIKEVEDEEINSNPTFREIAFLDPNLLVGPTNLQRNSITGGAIYSDSSPEHIVRCLEESLSSCLYNVTLATKIYQTLEWRRLKEMLDKNEILFKNPLYYHDAWESFIFRKYDWEEDGDEFGAQLTGVEKHFYCSCWSACEESDGIWNNHIRGTSSGDNYSKNNDSKHNDRSKREESEDSPIIKIETTVGELLSSFDLDKFLGGRNIWQNFRAGAVSYFDEFELRTFKERTLHIIELLKDSRLQFYLPYLLWQSFFMKRKQFEYEKEIRFVLFDNANWKSLPRNQDSPGVFLRTTPRKWIHEVVVHPDCTEPDYENIRNRLLDFGIDSVVMSPLSKRAY